MTDTAQSKRSKKHNPYLVGIGSAVLLMALFAAPFVIFYLTIGSNIVDPGGTPEETAQILVEDRKFGFRGLKNIAKWKDELLEPLRMASDGFTKLDNRNSVWIAEVLARNRSPKSLAIATELYKRTEIRQRLVGAIALAAHGALPSAAFDAGGLLREVIQRPQTTAVIAESTNIQLALTAMGYSRDDRAVPLIVIVLQRRRVGYHTHAEACLALKRIGRPAAAQAIPVLISALGDREFYALPEAFSALIALGERRAIPLAIERIEPEDENPRDRRLVDELEAVTGEDHGFDVEAWRAWWARVGGKWRIPKGHVSRGRLN